MRELVIAAGLVAALALAGCGKEDATQATAPAPAARKELGRPAQMYQGQAKIESVQTGSVASAPGGGVLLQASGTTAGPGWKNTGFLPYIYPATPPDGVYSVDVVADQPAGGAAAAPTAVEIKGDWKKYTDGRVKGIRFVSRTNEVVAMLPAK